MSDRKEIRYYKIRDFPNAVIMPRFVNVHTHLELTVLGIPRKPPFWDWTTEAH